MMDRVAQSPSRIPVAVKSPIRPVRKSIPKQSGSPTEGVPICSSYENGIVKEQKVVPSQENRVVSPQTLPFDKGFETFVMTGDMIIKTTSQKQKKSEDAIRGIERHHSDSASIVKVENKPFVRSGSSPDTSTLENNCSIQNVSIDDSQLKGENGMELITDKNRKPSAESGFEDQGLSSDTGTLEKKEKLKGDPNSVSDLSEVGSDDMLNTGIMTDSQSSVISSNVSTVSSPSDIRSDISVNTILRQEMEPLLIDEDSSSSIEISSPESSAGELSPDAILERSMSDSGGMSPTSKEEPSKSLVTSKSAERIVIQRQSSKGSAGPTPVRSSKSQENYFQDSEFALVSIEIDDDISYSLDQIPQKPESVADSSEYLTLNGSPHLAQVSEDVNKTDDKSGDRVFMPGFISIEEPKILKSKISKETKPNKALEHASDTSVATISGSSVPFEGIPQPLRTTEEPVLEGSKPSADQSRSAENGHVNQHVEQDYHSESTDSVVLEENYEFTSDGFIYHPPTKSVDRPSAQRLAKRLFNLDGFRKLDVCRHLSKKNDFSTLVAEEYLKFFNFQNDTLDTALRKFLKQFSLIGETQERERVLAHFSRRYMESNPGSYNSEDACHTLVCAIMLLNTDLHSQNVGRKMTCSEFIENLAELNDGENFPKEILKALYQAIKAEPIEWAPDDDGENRPDERVPPPSLPHIVGQNPFLDIPDPNQTTEYKKGYIMRKCCVEPDGRKTPLGKRGWKMFFASLQDMILYLCKDEHGMKKKSNYVDNSHNAIRVHHALASKATDYTKKQHVFKLQTADWAEYLFQTSNSKELQEWIDTINYVAASLSAPPLAGAVGSQRKFQRPLLPSSYTRLNLQDQLRSHEERVHEVDKDLHEHRAYPPEKGAKSRIIHDYIEKETYLEFELKRLRTYILLLQSRLASHPELEPSLVETAIGEDEEGIQGVVSPGVAVSSGVVGSPGRKVHRSLSDRGPGSVFTSSTSTPVLATVDREYINTETEVTYL